METNCWLVRPVWLRYSLGEIKLFNVKLEMAVLDAHFTELPNDEHVNWHDWAAVPAHVDGALVRSQPTLQELPRLTEADTAIRFVPAQYNRFFVEFNSTFQEYLGQFSSKHRSNLKRDVRKFTEMSGGTLDWRCFRTPGEVADFLAHATALSKKTFQERLLGAGLPDSDEFKKAQLELAQQNRIRAFLLFDKGKPVSYLLTEVRAPDILLYRNLGYDPEYRSWSPGSVLHYVALERLFADGDLRMLDFTEGEGMHKQLFSTDSRRCADLYFFRPTFRIRALLALHSGLEIMSRMLVRALDSLGLKARVKKFIRSRA